MAEALGLFASNVEVEPAHPSKCPGNDVGGNVFTETSEPHLSSSAHSFTHSSVHSFVDFSPKTLSEHLLNVAPFSRHPGT